MAMFTIPLYLLAFVITLWITSFFARLLHAEKPDMAWVLLVWVFGIGLSFGILFGFKSIVTDKLFLLLASYSIPFLILTLSYKFINKMNWAGAITTNITAIAVGIISTVIMIVLLGKPLDSTIIHLASRVGLAQDVPVAEEKERTIDQSIDIDHDIVPVLKDKDLLNPHVIVALKRQQNANELSYKGRKFQPISIRRVNEIVGYTIRIEKVGGSVWEGSLNKVEEKGGELVIKIILAGGTATAPIAISSITKLEVYR
ncbi:MAG: hypothetical protein KAG28_07270 [Cocleimonas sp.]|nr:hypothetical protein [Cocleimonas sp.]